MRIPTKEAHLFLNNGIVYHSFRQISRNFFSLLHNYSRKRVYEYLKLQSKKYLQNYLLCGSMLEIKEVDAV
jgi:hypothetical protein